MSWKKIGSQVLSELSTSSQLRTALLLQGCVEHPEAVQTLSFMDTG